MMHRYDPAEMFMLHDEGRSFVVFDVNTATASPSLTIEVHQVIRSEPASSGSGASAGTRSRGVSEFPPARNSGDLRDEPVTRDLLAMHGVTLPRYDPATRTWNWPRWTGAEPAAA